MKEANKEALKKLTFTIDEGPGKKIIPTILCGATNAIKGSIEIVNKGDKKVRLKSIPITGTNLKCRDGSPLNEIKVFQRLRPGEKINVSLSIDLDPQTPPGSYKGELIISEKKKSFVINVSERQEINISPGRFIIKNEPGAQIEKTIFVENTGNVKVLLNEINRTMLEEQHPYCIPIRNALKLGADKGSQAVLDILAKELNQTLNKAGTLIIKNKILPVEILPGETKQVDFLIYLPKTLVPTKGYIGRVPIFNKFITIIMQPV